MQFLTILISVISHTHPISILTPPSPFLFVESLQSPQVSFKGELQVMGVFFMAPVSGVRVFVNAKG